MLQFLISLICFTLIFRIVGIIVQIATYAASMNHLYGMCGGTRRACTEYLRYCGFKDGFLHGISGFLRDVFYRDSCVALLFSRWKNSTSNIEYNKSYKNNDNNRKRHKKHHTCNFAEYLLQRQQRKYRQYYQCYQRWWQQCGEQCNNDGDTKNPKSKIHNSEMNGMSVVKAREILCVTPNASRAEIQAAFRRLIMQHHPDKGGSRHATYQILEAKKILLN